MLIIVLSKMINKIKCYVNKSYFFLKNTHIVPLDKYTIRRGKNNGLIRKLQFPNKPNITKVQPFSLPG